ncbi:MAG: GNAT family N-acetyltransferase [Phycisphaerales bacterium]
MDEDTVGARTEVAARAGDAPPREREPTEVSDRAKYDIRRIGPADSIAEITRLLHRAYAKQVAMGLRPLAGRQDESVTRRRVGSGECFVAVDDAQRIGGVIILNEQEPDEGPQWFTRPKVASFSQLAVDPDAQGSGLGRRLLEAVEARAAELGNVELALSMAEPDTDLRDFYMRRGFRVIQTWKWPYTNYLSLIMSKGLTTRALSDK